jgi:hypothetical protein
VRSSPSSAGGSLQGIAFAALALSGLGLSLVACGPSPSASDAGPDAARDAGRDAGAPPGDAALPPPPPSEPGRHAVEVVETRRVVPSDGLGVEPMHSNNNLDVIRHEGRVYLAWRSSPDHFAGPETVIHVVSSADEVTWELENTLSIGTDLREPRWLTLDGRLLLYVSVLGVNRFAFEPMGVRVTERLADGTWTELEDVGLPGYIAWRTRNERGTPYMMAYLGGEHIYLFDGEPLSVELLTTADGRVWEPVDATRRAVYTGGGSEADFAVGDDGTLFGVIRNEAGDALGRGSLVCRAPADDLAAWSCRIDPRKYDSPLMFWHDGEAYLIGRRNVTETGHYDLMTDDGLRGTLESQTDYTMRPKRCALWRYVPEEDRIAFVLDLPSGGDTCFPAMIPGASSDELVVYDYSCDVDDPATARLAWQQGQLGNTYVYRHVLRFTPR